jgi:hypothetical protein
MTGIDEFSTEAEGLKEYFKSNGIKPDEAVVQMVRLTGCILAAIRFDDEQIEEIIFLFRRHIKECKELMERMSE